ncbi:hypothetical protein F751_4128 [Auxenochlorella protothecoides]|uniref:Uncharacterized protein n=1 Tax=Auxenochlorella protothecoides TaxID=3075 RepID=A0A087SP95_AUXPR|nr:hypothetical protein F751_4128 [Auxenochlorella protothecoides]KFM27549.1 hypothetical protein F751_4128 [Auxenochlorella protothecoides]
MRGTELTSDRAHQPSVSDPTRMSMHVRVHTTPSPLGPYRRRAGLRVDEEGEGAPPPARQHAPGPTVQPHQAAIDAQPAAQLGDGVGVVRRKLAQDDAKHARTQVPFQLRGRGVLVCV